MPVYGSYKTSTGYDGKEYGSKAPRERAGGGVKPGAENGPKILPEPPAESEGCSAVYAAQALIGPAGSARYSARRETRTMRYG